MTTREDWRSVMSDEEKQEFTALETSIDHLKAALTSLSNRRGIIRNRVVMRLNWRKNHVGNE